MKLKFLSILGALCSLFIYENSIAQGILRGKVYDELGETAVGVTILLKDNKTIGTATDLDGNFNLKIPDNKPHTVVVSLVSYRSIEENIQIEGGNIVIKNFSLVPLNNELTAVEIVAKVNKSKEFYMENIKMNSAISMNYISGETMKKTGDPNVVAAVARVSGVSTNSGFITVRGIGDRYVKTTLNGARIPTLDPFSNNIKLDMFPSSLVDNIVISKTATPDVPGDWAGAYLSVIPKDFPDKLTIDIETSAGYNNQSTFKEVITTSGRSSTDFLGFDNSYRVRDHSKFNDANLSPSQYQELSALGLEEYYKNMGVNGWSEGSTEGINYFKLGLIQLGLMSASDFNDQTAFNKAKQDYYEGDFQKKAFSIINKDVPSTGTSFNNDWNPKFKTGPVNLTQSFSIGNQISLFGRPLGFIGGFRYGQQLQYDPVSTNNRAAVAFDSTGELTRVLSTQMSQQVSRETNAWSALFNLSYKFNPNNNISLLFMPNFLGENNVRSSVDRIDPTNYILNKSIFYEQRRQIVYQYQSEHYVPSIKLKIDATASYTRGKSDAPDFKNTSYTFDPNVNIYNIGATVGDGINRFYRYITENIFDSRVNFELPIGSQSTGIRKIRWGASYLNHTRNFDQYIYTVQFGPFNTIQLKDDDLNAYMDNKNFQTYSYTDANGKSYNTIDMFYNRLLLPSNNSFGNSSVISSYLMSDYAITSRFRLVGGVRIEKCKIYTDVNLYDSLNYKRNDPRRKYSIGFPTVNPGILDTFNILPSVNLIYKVIKSETNPLNIRANYSQTLARPSIRELSDIAIYDYEYRAFIIGNSDLKQVQINNYDLRVEEYFENGDNVSVSAFYKDFRNHIELIRAGGFSWQNIDRAFVQGIELEGRKKIYKGLDLSANATFVKSETRVNKLMDLSSGERKYIDVPETTRPMFGQAPYIYNAILSYTSDSLGLTLSASYNVQGKRLVIVSDVKEIPNIFEMPRHMINLKASKKFGKHINVSITVRDLLNTPIRRTYIYDDGYEVDFDKFRFGTNYILSVGYKF